MGVVAEFPLPVLAEADDAARDVRLPALDLTDVPFATLDPPGSRDLDQAYALERTSAGFRVRYAIADVASFVRPGGAVDAEAHRRVETLYAPDVRVPLHPPVLSEGAASLLPGADRPAAVWTLDVDGGGVLTGATVVRAVVRSREQQDYPTVQRDIDAGAAPVGVALLAEVGRVLLAAQERRGGMTLGVPEQVVLSDDGGYRLAFRAPLQVEDWNAQLSLLTGMAAARLMLDAGVGVLRTMPPAAPHDVHRLRRTAGGLGIDWPADESYGELLGRLDARRDHEAAFLAEAAGLFRGAAYVSFDGAAPTAPLHAAIAAPYAHCTAPLRRLVDRYASETCLAICAGEPVPDWVKAALPDLPEEMARGGNLSHRIDNADLNLVEAAVLAGHEGQVFDGLVVDLDERRGGGTVQLARPAVRGRLEATHGPLPLGEHLKVRLLEADVQRRLVRFAPVS